jgi:hypothetical protein
MIRGTTAQFKFKLPYPKDELYWATIKFWQPNNQSDLLPITKRLIHCDSSDNSNELHVSLTAEETSRFSEKYKMKVQLRAQHLTNGTVFGSRVESVTVYPMSDSILGDDSTLPAANDDGWVVLDGEEITT